MAINMTTIEFAAWEPDQPAYGGQQALDAQNVIPGKRGYRCMPGLAKMAKPALSSSVLGAFSMKDLSGGLITVASTEHGIFSLDGAEWAQKHSGAALSSNREFVSYGDVIYALYGTILLKAEVSGAVQDFSAVKDAPAAARLGIIKDFLVLGKLSGQGNAIRWSGIDDPDAWPAPGSNDAQYKQSDIQIFPVGGNVQAIVGGVGGVDGLIFMEEAVHRAMFVGPPYVFQFNVVDRRRGALASHSPIVCETTCIYLASDGWYATDGASVRAIGAERIDQWFFDTCDMDRVEEVRGVWDAQNRVAFWSFPDNGCPHNIHNRLLIYNYIVDKWSYAKLNTEFLFEDYARGMTLEDLDVYGSLEDVPFSLDSSGLKNRSLGISAFDMEHTLSRFSGDALEAVIDTAEVGGQRVFMHGIRPLVDRGDAEAAPVWRILQRDIPSFGTYSRQSRDGVCYQHLSANYIRARVRIPSGKHWLSAVGCEVMAELEGGI